MEEYTSILSITSTIYIYRHTDRQTDILWSLLSRLDIGQNYLDDQRGSHRYNTDAF